MINWRYNPFTKVFNPTSLTEYHVVEFMDDANMYGFQLYEAPQRVATLGLSMTVVQYITGGATWTEVSRNTAPNAGQYRVDYDADTFFGTGRINFNAADVGKVFSVSYQGLGTIVSESNISRLASGYFPRIAVFETPGTSTWNVPQGVTQAYVKVIGGGGAGARAAVSNGGAGGGGGGGVSEKLCSIPYGTTSISVTVGAGGTVSHGAAATSGGQSSFGSYCFGPGGGVGADQPTTGAHSGGASGIGTSGDLNYGLGDGSAGSQAGGTGGGPGGTGGYQAVGTAGNKYGGGGGGGGSDLGSYYAGGNGASGLVVIYY